MRRARARPAAALAVAVACAATAPAARAEEGGDNALPEGHPPVTADGARAARSLFDAPPVAVAQPSPAVPPGTVEVTVVDAEGRPVERASVLLGVMAQGGDRTRIPGSTNENGIVVYRELATGSGRAYRVNVPYEGATYSSPPFQLPPDHGYAVRVVRLPVTRDDRTVLQLVGQTYVEVRDERLHVVQQAQLANMSPTPQTYVFPEDGLRVALPEGYLAFQTQPVMSDQRVEEIAGFGMRIRGSLPPGRVTLTWAFDVPITGANMDLVFAVPFRTYVYRVITDAPPGMSLEVDPLPPVESFEDEGRRLFGTEIQRRPGDPPFEQLTMRFRGIPGPGPARWVAVGLALGLLALGLALAIFGGGSRARPLAAESLARKKRELLEEAAELEREFARGEIGPQWRQKRRAAIVRELAVLLHQEKAAAQASDTSSPEA